MQLKTLVILAQLIQLSSSQFMSASSSDLQQPPQAPQITPFTFNQNVQENQRSSVLCTISSGDLPVTIQWLKDGQLLSKSLADAKKITIKPDLDQSTLKLNQVKLEHAGNYTCLAKNRAGVASYSAQLIVHGEPRWLREPLREPLEASRGQTVIIDCQSLGWPKPQQTWLIKNMSQLEFEPLAATGRISLAVNGSLVIRNADKSDEANYLCKSFNGIGKGITRNTSLKVTVPAHFEASNNKHQQQVTVKKQNQVQLRCDAFGDEPISIEWYKNQKRITNELDPRYSIHNNPLKNVLISILVIRQTQRQDNSIYECVTRNPAGKDTLPIELLVQEEPDSIQELQASQVNSRAITLVWQEPYDGRSAITSYMFQYKKLQESQSSFNELLDFGSADSTLEQLIKQQPVQHSASHSHHSSQQQLIGTTTADDWQQASRIILPVAPAASNASATIRSMSIEKLEPSSKYVLRALAINAIGQSRFSQPMEFTTEEEAPELIPTNIRAAAINSTSIQVSWDEIQRGKQVGRIHGYYIGYRVANSTGQFVYKPYIINDIVLQQQQQQQQQELQIQSNLVQRLDSIIQDLRRDTVYEITVVAFNSRGSGPSSDFVLCKTIEMEVPRPVKLQIRRESNESIFIEWNRDVYDQNPVDDYVLYQEKNSASQEWLQVRLPGNQSQYKAPGLKCGTRYQFYIIAHNKVGKSQPSEVVSASTSGALPVIPSKMSLIKMLNSTCLMVNLNSFQDNGCRIKTFTVRYRVEKSVAPNGSTLISSNGIAANQQALTAASQLGGKTVATGSSLPSTSSEWITIRPKSNAKHQRANEEDRLEFLCDLNPIGEYTIHVAASNDVGRSEIEYTVLMSSDELRHSALKELLEVIWSLPNIFSYLPTVLVFLMAGLFMSLVSLVLYTTSIKYYQKFVIMHNQMRATRRAKQDEKRRRKLNSSRHSQKVDLWAEEYDEDIENGDDEDEDDDDSSNSASATLQHRNQYSNSQNVGHYLTNLRAGSQFDTSSIDTPCNKFQNGSTCMSTASTDSIHGRFQCLNSKQYVKMNEYTMLPSISASLSPAQDIYGTTAEAASNNPNNSLYYSTLRRSSMQTYLPTQRRQQSPQQQQQQQQQQQHLNHQHRRQSQNFAAADIYGYYLAPQSASTANQAQQQAAAEEAANSIFVPPQQIIYGVPNMRHQPMFL